MLWRTSTKADRSKVLNLRAKTFSIPLVRGFVFICWVVPWHGSLGLWISPRSAPRGRFERPINERSMTPVAARGSEQINLRWPCQWPFMGLCTSLCLLEVSPSLQIEISPGSLFDVDVKIDEPLVELSVRAATHASCVVRCVSGLYVHALCVGVVACVFCYIRPLKSPHKSEISSCSCSSISKKLFKCRCFTLTASCTDSLCKPFHTFLSLGVEPLLAGQGLNTQGHLVQGFPHPSTRRSKNVYREAPHNTCASSHRCVHSPSLCVDTAPGDPMALPFKVVWTRLNATSDRQHFAIITSRTTVGGGSRGGIHGGVGGIRGRVLRGGVWRKTSEWILGWRYCRHTRFAHTHTHTHAHRGLEAQACTHHTAQIHHPHIQNIHTRTGAHITHTPSSHSHTLRMDTLTHTHTHAHTRTHTHPHTRTHTH